MAVPEPREPEIPAVTGVLEFDLADLPDWPTIPSGVSAVRATVGHTWADMTALDRLASAAWVARVSVEIVGTNGQVVVDALRSVRRRLNECRRADAELEALQRRAVNG